MDLSIVIPAYNEERRIGKTLDEIKDYLDAKGLTYEVIAVCDGSTDRTRKIVRSSALAESGQLKLLKNRQSRGKGYAVERGMRVADGELVMFTDADLSTPICEVDKLMEAIRGGADIAVGSRSIYTSQVAKRQPFYRQTMGKTFNFIIRFILREKIKDTQCGFKMFKRDVAEVLFKEIRVRGFAFDAELLFLAKKKGFKVKEIGVKWENSPESKVHPVISSLEMLRDVIKVRFIHR